jgi:hypothetical protein
MRTILWASVFQLPEWICIYRHFRFLIYLTTLLNCLDFVGRMMRWSVNDERRRLVFTVSLLAWRDRGKPRRICCDFNKLCTFQCVAENDKLRMQCIEICFCFSFVIAWSRNSHSQWEITWSWSRLWLSVLVIWKTLKAYRTFKNVSILP